MRGEQVVFTGRHGDWHWMCSHKDEALDALVTRVPELVRGRFVAITSHDSGPLKPTEGELRMGWHAEGDVLWTCRIDDPAVLPADEYDEWYVFEHPVTLRVEEVFVNRPFTLCDPEPFQRADPAWDRELCAGLRRQQEAFWDQLERIEPAAYLANGELLILATRNAHLLAAALAWAQSPS